MSETRIEWGNKTRYPNKEWTYWERDSEQDAQEALSMYESMGREAKVVSRVVKVSDWVEH